MLSSTTPKRTTRWWPRLSAKDALGMRCSLLLLIATLISGCGFHLRGLDGEKGNAQPLAFDTVRVLLNTPNVRLQHLLEQALQRRDVSVTTTADLQLVISRFQQDRRTVALNSAAKAAEYELKTAAEFYLLAHKQGSVSKTSTVTVLRNYSNDPDQVTGKLEEERLLQDEMLREVVKRIIQRLQTTEINRGTEGTPPATTQQRQADDGQPLETP